MAASPTNPVVKLPVFYLCFVQNRGRLAEKRTIPLPPNRVPKKELSSIFSSDDSEGSERASGDHAHIKQEEELPYSIMRKRWDARLHTRNDSCLLDTLIINETHAEPRKEDQITVGVGNHGNQSVA